MYLIRREVCVRVTGRNRTCFIGSGLYSQVPACRGCRSESLEQVSADCSFSVEAVHQTQPLTHKTAIQLLFFFLVFGCERTDIVAVDPTELCLRLLGQIRLRCWRPHAPWRNGCSSFRRQPQTARPWRGRSAGTGKDTWSAS